MRFCPILYLKVRKSNKMDVCDFLIEESGLQHFGVNKVSFSFTFIPVCMVVSPAKNLFFF